MDSLEEDGMVGVPALLATAMRARGFTELTAVQQAVLAAAPEGRDLRISSQTGSGKTVAIGLGLAPALLDGERASRDRHVLVLVPTRELAMQVRDELKWLFAGASGLGVELVMGGAPMAFERRALSRNPQIVVGTPGRLLDHLRTGAYSPDRVAGSERHASVLLETIRCDGVHGAAVVPHEDVVGSPAMAIGPRPVSTVGAGRGEAGQRLEQLAARLV